MTNERDNAEEGVTYLASSSDSPESLIKVVQRCVRSAAAWVWVWGLYTFTYCVSVIVPLCLLRFLAECKSST